mmetsp:Transcript_17479/g.31733  ORF Transcript_17479/g.31733 Transcript_17479/m.31733 type:complete len:315 (+) Transcript_17479:1-945(+)
MLAQVCSSVNVLKFPSMVDRPLDGFVYGKAPQKLQEPPDVAGMLEAAGIPNTGPDQVLPFSLEWYAGAPKRQAAREEEIQGKVATRNDLRTHWAKLVRSEMESWGSQVEKLLVEPEPFDLVTLLARTVTERPDDADEINNLRSSFAKADGRRGVLREELGAVRERQLALDDAVRDKEEKDFIAEKERQEREAAEKARKAKAEAALRRAAKAMYGEDEDEEEEAEADAAQAEPASPTEDLGEMSASTFTGGPPGEGGPLPPLQSPPVASFSPPGSVRGSPATLGIQSGSASNTPSRSGYSRELPPLNDPPPPPVL